MTYNFKALGLVLVMLFAMCAVIAPAAQATSATFSWPSTTKHFTWENDPTDTNIHKTITGGKFAFDCNIVKGETTVAGTGSESIPAQSTTLSNSEKAADTCKGPLNSNAPIKMNGCTFTLRAGTTLKEAPSGESEGTTDIVCPPGKEITTEPPLCIVHIPAQSGLGPVYYRTVKTGALEELTVEVQIGHPGPHKKAIKYHHTGAVCGTSEGEDGTYTGKITVKGYSENKTTQTDVTVT